MISMCEIAEKLNSHDKLLVFCHVRPDGDTLGSAFAIKRFLENSGKTVDVVCDSPIPEKFSFLGFKAFKPSEITGEYSAHVAVDCSTENMLGDGYVLYKKCVETFNIDHHISNTRYGKYFYVDDRAACCEIVYELLTALGGEICKSVADCLLLGISTDTGHYMHSNVTVSTFKISSELLACGGDSHEIGVKMFKNQTRARATLQADIMSKMKFFEDGKIAFISIMQSDLEKFGATSDLTEGFIDYPLSIEGVEVAVSVLESRQNAYKISLRSKGRVNVNEVAAGFGGGGHILASGCMLFGFFEDVKDKIIRAITLSL